MSVLPRPGGALARSGALGVVALVATASLMPNVSVPDSAPGHTDLAIHLAMQGALGFALVWAWPRQLVLVGAALAILVVGLEMGQIWIPGRGFAWTDLVTNVLGGGLGALLAFRSGRPRMRLRTGMESGDSVSE